MTIEKMAAYDLTENHPPVLFHYTQDHRCDRWAKA